MPFWDTIFSVIFPARCLACGRGGRDLCLECLSSCPPAERESAQWIFPVYDYRDQKIKKSLWLFKYSGRKRFAGIFARSLFEKMLEELSELSTLENFREPLLVPIPLSSKRLRERGYNQAELLCKEILNINKNILRLKLVSDILFKPHDTEHQARIRDRKQRLQNMRGTFATKNAEKLKGKNIILIDDILTTGATLSEARRILRDAGARKIIAFTIAH